MGYLRHAFLCLIAFALTALFLSAQAPTSKLFGVVTDEEGNPLPGVAVEALSLIHI